MTHPDPKPSPPAATPPTANPPAAPDPIALNRARWDELARVHGQDGYYDVEGFLRGGSSLHERELSEMAAALGSVEGKDVLHLQCHFGLDTLSWARQGARVTGVDFSPVAVARARELARRAGLDADFIEADVQRLPDSLAGRFDVVFASYGVLAWIADIGAWMRGAAAALRPGGKLVLVELHPVFVMFDTVDPLALDCPYQSAEPLRYTCAGSYADGSAKTAANDIVQYAHGLGAIVTAAAAAGLRVEALTEWLDEAFDPRGRVLTREADGRFRLPLAGQDLPVAFGLRAARR